jgi:LacI family transcriptional regulator
VSQAGRPTIKDIALEVGVSTATISRVLNDSGRVAPSTRAAVLSALQRRSFTSRRKRVSDGLVAVYCPYVRADYFGLLLSAVVDSLERHGKRLMLNFEDTLGEAERLSPLLLCEMTEGAVLILPPEPMEFLVRLRALNYPFVVLDTRLPLPPNVAAVSAAHMAGAQMLTSYLIGLGHERIAAICGPPEWLSTEGRLAGFRAALAETGRLAPAELIEVGGEPTIENGRRAARPLLALPEPPTAIVTYNDKMAVGVMHAAAEAGLRVPDDLTVAGFDGFELSQIVRPRLTTVRQPVNEMALMSVELLLRLIERRETDMLQVVLGTELIVGGSSAPPPASR